MKATRETDSGSGHRINAAGLALAVVLFFGGVALVNWAQARGYISPKPESSVTAADAVRAAAPEGQERLKAADKPSPERVTLLPPINLSAGKQQERRTYQPRARVYASAPARRARTTQTVNTPAPKAPAPKADKREIPVVFKPESHPELKMGAGTTAASSGPGMLPDLSSTIGGSTARKPAPPAPAAAAGQPTYSVKLKPTGSKYLADTVADTLHSHGFEGANAQDNGDGTYSVKVGEFNFRYAAENAKQQLNTLGFSGAEVKEPGQ